MNLHSVNDLQLLHVHAAQVMRKFRNSIEHAERFETRADDLIYKDYCLEQAKAYREQAQECAEEYQEIHLQIITLTDNMVLCPKLQLA